MTIFRKAPAQVTRGLPDTKFDLREVPNVKFSAVSQDDYKLLASGWDTVQESFDLKVNDKWHEKLLELKELAQESGRNGSPVMVEIQGHPFQVMPSAWRGSSHLLQNDVMQIGLSQRDWGVSVKYLAAGLWEYGVNELREFARFIIFELCGRPYKKDWERVSRCDFCFDIHSPKFTEEMRPAIIEGLCCLSRVKDRVCFKTEAGQAYCKGATVQTITIGSKANLQVEIYDKSLEIRENSKKTWFYEIWGEAYQKDVWRLELRFSGNFLKNRKILVWEDVEQNLEYLITEALISRRLSIPDYKDKNKSRWAIHPIWSLAYEARGTGEMLQLGRKYTQTREQLTNNLRRQIAGSLRNVVVLASRGKFDWELVEEQTKAVFEVLRRDKDHESKVQRSRDRYVFIDAAG